VLRSVALERVLRASRLLAGVVCGVEVSDIDHGEETRGGSGSKVKIDAISLGVVRSKYTGITSQ